MATRRQDAPLQQLLLLFALGVLVFLRLLQLVDRRLDRVSCRLQHEEVGLLLVRVRLRDCVRGGSAGVAARAQCRQASLPSRRTANLASTSASSFSSAAVRYRNEQSAVVDSEGINTEAHFETLVHLVWHRLDVLKLFVDLDGRESASATSLGVYNRAVGVTSRICLRRWSFSASIACASACKSSCRALSSPQAPFSASMSVSSRDARLSVARTDEVAWSGPVAARSCSDALAYLKGVYWPLGSNRSTQDWSEAALFRFNLRHFPQLRPLPLSKTARRSLQVLTKRTGSTAML